MTRTVVVADDHQEMRHLIVELLESQGYEVRQATDSDGVLEEVRRSIPDLLILDVHMPGAGGLEVLKSIRSDPELGRLPVLILSGSVELAADWPQKVGADAYLPKPFAIDDLNSTVRTLLAA
jgi:CheY-like chemotaxis protein